MYWYLTNEQLFRERLKEKSEKIHEIYPKGIDGSSFTSGFQGNLRERHRKDEAQRIWWVYSFILLIKTRWLPDSHISIRDYRVHFCPFCRKPSSKQLYIYLYLMAIFSLFYYKCLYICVIVSILLASRFETKSLVTSYSTSPLSWERFSHVKNPNRFK